VIEWDATLLVRTLDNVDCSVEGVRKKMHPPTEANRDICATNYNGGAALTRRDKNSLPNREFWEKTTGLGE